MGGGGGDDESWIDVIHEWIYIGVARVPLSLVLLNFTYATCSAKIYQIARNELLRYGKKTTE